MSNYYEVKSYLDHEKDKDLIEILQRISNTSGLPMARVVKMVLLSEASNFENNLRLSKKRGLTKRAPDEKPAGASFIQKLLAAFRR